ncbi:hypothetical protein CEXT_45071 [Caerostris extrusa]|uniref:Uncharacterized protein n=1 Tax=Caerostris extrusa TaxID=172846 RepID=A0AAV4US23_CAEEX|nr:hypothetical protein CEXT_45071 [Caerostris extrusa]
MHNEPMVTEVDYIKLALQVAELSGKCQISESDVDGGVPKLCPFQGLAAVVSVYACSDIFNPQPASRQHLEAESFTAKAAAQLKSEPETSCKPRKPAGVINSAVNSPSNLCTSQSFNRSRLVAAILQFHPFGFPPDRSLLGK